MDLLANDGSLNFLSADSELIMIFNNISSDATSLEVTVKGTLKGVKINISSQMAVPWYPMVKRQYSWLA